MSSEPTKLRGKPVNPPFSLCFLNKHVPDRQSAKWDGSSYVSHCLNCGHKIRRKTRNNWKRENRIMRAR